MLSLTTIYTIGAAQGLILAVALIRKLENKPSNRVLSLWLILLSFDLIMRILFLNDEHTPFLIGYIISRFFPFLYGSFFYLYVRTLITNQNIKIRDFIHFIGYIVTILLNIDPIIKLTNNQPSDIIFNNLILYVYSIGYVIAGFMLIIAYRKSLQQQKVDIEGIDLRLLKHMAIWQIIIWLIAVSQWLLPIDGFSHWTIYIAISIWITLMGYLGLSQHQLEPIKKLKQPTSISEDTRFDEVKIKLNALINDEKIHLQSSLTIGQLAKISGYPEYLISLFINRIHNMNFRDYINYLRIDEAKSMLIDKANKRTILDIAYECGFNSKSTFNSAFKKNTHQTPSAFMQQQRSTAIEADKS